MAHCSTRLSGGFYLRYLLMYSSLQFMCNMTFVSADQTFYQYSADYEHVDTSSETSLQRNRLDCSHMCAASTACRSYSYDTDTDICTVSTEYPVMSTQQFNPYRVYGKENECPEGTTLCPPTNRCIALVTDLVRADAAMSSCEGAGGRLARFPSEQALDWFFEMRYSHNGSHQLDIWVGITAPTNGSEPTWEGIGSSYGIEIGSEYWHRYSDTDAEPNRTGPCVNSRILEDLFYFRDAGCDSSNFLAGFMCEYQLG